MEEDDIHREGCLKHRETEEALELISLSEKHQTQNWKDM
jgi:hypothetical protein